MHDVKKISFEFLERQIPKNSAKKVAYITTSSWAKDKEKLPAYLTINLLTKANEDLSFTFFLPSPQSIIIYYE